MADERHDPLGDLINLLAAPLASGIRTFEQVRRGIDELFRAIENLNATMEKLGETTERLNRLLSDLEEAGGMSASHERDVDDPTREA